MASAARRETSIIWRLLSRYPARRPQGEGCRGQAWVGAGAAWIGAGADDNQVPELMVDHVAVDDRIRWARTHPQCALDMRLGRPDAAIEYLFDRQWSEKRW
ncbi:hypothetical protein MESS4_110082 [Mesorhizobium sp. STM 4661]|nr:hypothetical protein MESS4_110082 [Mesorhizobium sp. STM 4661]